MREYNSSYKQVLVAADFSEHSERVVEKAVEIVKQSDAASLHLVHIVEIPVYPVLEDIAVMGMPGLWDESVTETLLQASQKKLQQIAEAYSIEQTHLVAGIPATDIVNYASQINADLIVVGSHGASGIKRLIGSTAHAIINDADCDVLSVKIRDKEC